MKILIDLTCNNTQVVETITSVLQAGIFNGYSITLLGDKQFIQNKSSWQESVLVKVESGSIEQIINKLKEEADNVLLTFSDPKRIYSVLDSIPAHSTLFINDDKPIMFLDSGVNTDPDSEMLLHFALLANQYMKVVMNVKQPRVSILSNGEEEGKGTQLIRDTGLLLQDSPINYIGNIEPAEIIEGNTDIVITDGYTGDVFLRTFVPAMRYLLTLIRDERDSNVLTTVGEFIANSGLERTDQEINAFQSIGGPLLDYNNMIFWCPPNATTSIVSNALRNLQKSIETQFIQVVTETNKSI